MTGEMEEPKPNGYDSQCYFIWNEEKLETTWVPQAANAHAPAAGNARAVIRPARRLDVDPPGFLPDPRFKYLNHIHANTAPQVNCPHIVH